MKKILLSLLVVICLVALVFSSQWLLSKGNNKEEDITTASTEEIAEGKSTQSKQVSGALPGLDINSNSSQDDVLSVMHMMTHQKIIANDKWGAILMTPENIVTVHEIIELNNYPDKNVLLKITKRWKTGDFGSVDHDHNRIWRLQGGTIGKAQGIMTDEEERWFIIHNFGDEAAENWLDNQ